MTAANVPDGDLTISLTEKTIDRCERLLAILGDRGYGIRDYQMKFKEIFSESPILKISSKLPASLIVWSSRREGATATLSIEAIHTVGAVVDSRICAAGDLFSG